MQVQKADVRIQVLPRFDGHPKLGAIMRPEPGATGRAIPLSTAGQIGIQRIGPHNPCLRQHMALDRLLDITTREYPTHRAALKIRRIQKEIASIRRNA